MVELLPSEDRRFAFSIRKGKEIKGVPHSKAQSLIKEEALKGGLFWNGTKLLIDLLAPYTLVVKAEKKKEGALLSAHLKRGERLIPLTDIEELFFSETPLFIHPPFLSRVNTEVDYRILYQLKEGALLLRERDWLAFKEDYEAEIVEEGEAAHIDILPVLRLADRMGAFANLFLKYGDEEVLFLEGGRFCGDFLRRHEEEAAWEKDLLETSFVIKERGSSRYFCPMDEVAKSLTFLLELGWVIYDAQGKKLALQKEALLSFNETARHLEIKGSFSFDDYEVDLAEVVGAFNRKERFLNLSEESVALLDYEKLSFPEDLEFEENKVLLPRFRFGEAKEMAERYFSKPQIAQLFECQQTEIDASFKGTLYPFQQKGVNFLHFLYQNQWGGLLADEMGLGKSVQVLAFFSLLTNPKPKVIICPTSLIFNWRREIEKFLPGRKVEVYEGKDRLLTAENESIVITSYALLRLDWERLSAIEFDVAVFDEAHYFKNPESQTFKALKQLNASCRISLSGTPLENKPLDIWTQYALLMPGLFEDHKHFSLNSHLPSIQRRMAPFFLRRKKIEVLDDLPEKIEQTVWVEMDEEQRLFYDETLKKAKGASGTMEILEAILRLRQVCCDPRLVGGEVKSAKLEALITDLESVVASGAKVIVYSQFTQMLTLIKKELTVPYLYLDGATKNREEIVTRFQEDESMPLILMSLKAGGVGLNLTAADYIFLYDPWWNETAENQAIDRAHRLGRKKAVIAKRYITSLSIEEKIMTLKEHKRKLCAQILDLESQAFDITKEDLLQLLS